MQDLFDIINIVRSKLTDDSDLSWTGYNTAKELREELDRYINQLNAGNLSFVGNLNIHFLPTSTFQEHSLQNGWSEEYMELAEKFERIYTTLKGNL